MILALTFREESWRLERGLGIPACIGSRNGLFRAQNLPLMTCHQVVFDPDNAHRRKSSIVLTEAPKLARRESDQRKASSCIVHKFLDTERPQFDTKLHHIEEDRVRSGNIDGTSTPQ